MQPKIWIIEDDQAIQELLDLQLKGKGMGLEFFTGGTAALEKLAAGSRPDLILLDIMMRGIDGFETLEQIRERYGPHELPVLMLSAIGADDHIERGLTLGANDYITKPYRIEQLIARIHSHLRVKDLVLENLHTLKDLQELEKVKDSAILTASHDLKGPLNAILAGLFILREDLSLPERDQENYLAILESMMESAGMMKPIIEEFLDLEALKAQRLRLEKGFFSLNTLVQDVVTQYHNFSKQQGVTIVYDLDPDLKKCYADQLRITQVLGNLLSNAIKHSPRAGTILVRTQQKKSMLRVEVQDHGAGIPKDDIPRLFEMFTPLSTRNKSKGGTGVGLYISRQLIEMHEGSLNVESVPEQGSTFWFEIPACVYEDSDTSPQTQSSRSNEAASAATA